jgi:hypothetical protein
MISYKTKFIIYKSNSSKEVFFLNHNFQINAIIKLKKEINKIIALDAQNPNVLSYIYKDFTSEPQDLIPDNVLFHENLISEYEQGSDKI